MPPKQKNVTVFVFNIAVSSQQDSNKDYLQNGKELIKRTIEKMIFVESSRETGIILIGDPIDGNIIFQDIETASFDMIEKIEKIKAVKTSSTSWLDGLNAALNLIEHAVVDSRTSKKVILISNFPDRPSTTFRQFDKIVERMTASAISFLCYGGKALRTIPNEDCNENEQKIRQFCDRVEGFYFIFDEILPDIKFYEAADKRLMPWKCQMQIADIKFPIKIYVYGTKNEEKKSWIVVSTTKEDGCERDEPRLVTKVTQRVDRHRSVVSDDNTVRGYLLGREFFPVAEEDENGINLPKEEKSFKLHSFATEDSISIKHRTGYNTWIVLPDNDNDSVEEFIYLVKAMKEERLVALVRRIYQSNCGPTMHVLEPVVDDLELPWCFFMYDLISAEEEAAVHVQPLDSIQDALSESEKDVIGDLIDSMMVEKNGTEEEEAVPSPVRQHYWNILSHRALHPEDPLPQPEDYLMAALKPPKSIDTDKVQASVDKIKKLFELDTEMVESSDENIAAMDIDTVSEKEPSKEQSSKQSQSAEVDEDIVHVNLDDMFDF